MSRLRNRLAEAHLALVLLTRLPFGRLAAPVPSLAQAAWAFPLAGLAVGGLTAWSFAGARALGLTGLVGAGLALVVALLATGGLHEDGLGDVADGFGGGATRERKLEIMKDSRLGSYGAIALVMGLGLRWLLLAQVGQMQTIIAIAMASRAWLAAALLVMPAARPDGLGHAASGVGRWRVAVAVALGLLALGLTMPWLLALRVLLAMAAAVAALGLLAWRQIGGQTGDVLGAMQVVAEIAGWLVLAAIF